MNRGACQRATAVILGWGTVLPGQHVTSEEDTPAGFRPPFAVPSSHSRQSPVMGPDGDRQPPGACLRGTRAGHRILLRYQDAS